MYYIPQITSNDCLFTAFKILLANVKKDEKYLYLQEDEKHGAYSLLEIIEKAKTFGLDLFGFESDDKKELKGCKNVPLILNIIRGEQGLHSVYVYKVTRTKVYYLDSDIGSIVMPLEKFVSIWDGTGLMMRHCEDVKDDFEPIEIVTKKNPISKIFQVISAACFIFGIYFMDDKTSFIIPFCLVIAGALFDVFTKLAQIRDMKNFDAETMEYLGKIKNRNFSEFLPRREKLKESLFSAKNNYMFYLISCAFVIFVILLNNPLHIACIFMPVVLATIQSLIISPIEKRKNFEIEQMEYKFGKEKSSIYAGKTLDQIEKEAYQYSYFILAKNGLGILLFSACSFITLKVLNGFNIINVFFLLFTEIFLYQNLLPIFSYESRKVEEKLNYMRFINILQ